MAGSCQSPKTGQKLIGWTIYETIGIGVYNPMAFCTPGSIYIWDERPEDEGLVGNDEAV